MNLDHDSSFSFENNYLGGHGVCSVYYHLVITTSVVDTFSGDPVCSFIPKLPIY